MARLLEQVDGKLAGPVDIPEWVQATYGHFRPMMLNSDPAYPCHFGVIAEDLGFLRYTYLEPDEITNVQPLADTLVEYLRTYREIPGRSAIIGFVRTPEFFESAADYEHAFWGILQSLHDIDPQPWPDNQPTDPEDPYWEFCFGGEPIIVNGHAPVFQARLSRHAAEGISLIMQTRDSLNGVVGRSATSQAVRRKIRAAVEEYDDVSLSPVFGTLGEPGVLAWKEYWVPEENVVREDRCPLVIRRR